jgi:hypothetical protein
MLQQGQTMFLVLNFNWLENENEVLGKLMLKCSNEDKKKKPCLNHFNWNCFQTKNVK